MEKTKKNLIVIIFLVLVSFLVWFLYLSTEPVFISNPDSAKFGEVARNIKQGEGITTFYSICNRKVIDRSCFTFTSPPFYPMIVFLFMVVFGENDKALIYTSGFFFIFSVVLVFLLAKKLFNEKVAILSSVGFIFTEQFIFHSVSGAAETFFTFLLILNLIFVTEKNLVSIFLGGVVSFLLLGTKIQSPFYILGFLAYLVLRKKRKTVLFRRLGYYLLPFLALVFFIKYLNLFSLPNPAYFVNEKSLLYLLFYNSPLFPAGMLDQLKVDFSFSFLVNNFKPVFLKLVENFYTAFKNILLVTNPFIMVFFFLSFLKKEKRNIFLLKLLTFVWLLFFLFSGAVGVFNIRYVHPVLFLIIIFAIDCFLNFFGKMNIKRKEVVLGVYVMFFLVLYPITQINLGARILDKGKNRGKESIYKIIGEKIRKYSRKEDLVSTNVEIWGSWYGKRKTVLLANDPGLIAENIDLIVLSSYSPGTRLGNLWQEVFEGERDFDGFSYFKKIEINGRENYQNIPVEMVILKKK